MWNRRFSYRKQALSLLPSQVTRCEWIEFKVTMLDDRFKTFLEQSLTIMKFLELKIPPPALMLLAVAIMLGLRYAHLCPMANPLAIPVAVLFAVAGVAFGLPSLVRFRKAGTTILPTHPEQATQLVIDGMYCFSRNPMYLGATLILLAAGLFFDDGLALLPVPLFAVYLNFFQIIPEERALEKRFGDEYREYKKRVRRWI